MTGRITYWLMEAHRLAINPEARYPILRALQLVRRMHHDHHLKGGRPMTAAVVLAIPGLLALAWAYRAFVNRLRRSLDE